MPSSLNLHSCIHSRSKSRLSSSLEVSSLYSPNLSRLSVFYIIHPVINTARQQALFSRTFVTMKFHDAVAATLSLFLATSLALPQTTPSDPSAVQSPAENELTPLANEIPPSTPRSSTKKRTCPCGARMTRPGIVKSPSGTATNSPTLLLPSRKPRSKIKKTPVPNQLH